VKVGEARLVLHIQGQGLVEPIGNVEYVLPRFMVTLPEAERRYAVGSKHRSHLAVACGMQGATLSILTGQGQLYTLRALTPLRAVSPVMSGWFVRLHRDDDTLDVRADELIDHANIIVINRAK
jgi:hypothetical protein